MKDFRELKKKLLSDPAIRKACDGLDAEFQLIESIIDRRLARGLTQADLAKRLGTKQSAIARLESGTYNPSFSFLKRVAKALDGKLVVSIS